MALTLAMKTFETRVVGGDTLEPYEATEAFNPLAFISARAAPKAHPLAVKTQMRTLSGPASTRASIAMDGGVADGAVYDNTS